MYTLSSSFISVQHLTSHIETLEKRLIGCDSVQLPKTMRVSFEGTLSTNPKLTTKTGTNRNPNILIFVKKTLLQSCTPKFESQSSK